MKPQTFFAFRVRCRACYGTETWQLARIVRVLTDLGVSASATEPDVEQIAKLFVAYSSKIACSGCGKTGVLVERLHA